MKKIFKQTTLSIILIGIITTSLFAQEKTDKEVKFGIKGGVNMSNLYTKNVNNENALLGFNLGLFAKAPINRLLAVQPEIYYTTKGAKNTYNNVFANGTVKYTFNYIEVPILGILNITNNFTLQAGPYVGFLVSGKVRNESNVTLFDFEKDITTDNYNKIDAGLIGGLGMDVGNISVALRYNYGLTNVGKEKSYGSNTYTFPDGKNSVLSLNIALSMN